jgi:hypothetical protein
MTLPPSGFIYNEYYLYANKQWEVIPSGVTSYAFASGIKQNAPVIITASGYETTTSTDPWGQVAGSGKWKKRAHGHFTVTAAGVYDETVEEFTMNPDSSGRVEFNQITPDILYAEYEAWPSGYYNLDTLDVDPIRHETEGGFLQITDVTEPAALGLKATQSVIKADGFHRTNFIATLYDQNFNRVKDKEIVFEVLYVYEDMTMTELDMGNLVAGKLNGSTRHVNASGYVDETIATTNINGQATATFVTNAGKFGHMAFKAYYLNASGIYDVAEILLYNVSSNQFVIDWSVLDSLDFLGGPDLVWAEDGDSLGPWPAP